MQAAEAAAVEAYGDKVVSGTVIKQTEKHLVVDVGLKSEGLVPIEQVTDHTGAVRFQTGEVMGHQAGVEIDGLAGSFGIGVMQCPETSRRRTRMPMRWFEAGDSSALLIDQDRGGFVTNRIPQFLNQCFDLR